MILNSLRQKQFVFEITSVKFVFCADHKSKFLISFEKGIDSCEFDVLEAMLLYLACQIVAIDPRVLLGCLLANVNV